jgi:hypothetical protein
VARMWAGFGRIPADERKAGEGIPRTPSFLFASLASGFRTKGEALMIFRMGHAGWTLSRRRS